MSVMILTHLERESMEQAILDALEILKEHGYEFEYDALNEQLSLLVNLQKAETEEVVQ